MRAHLWWNLAGVWLPSRVTTLLKLAALRTAHYITTEREDKFNSRSSFCIYRVFLVHMPGIWLQFLWKKSLRCFHSSVLTNETEGLGEGQGAITKMSEAQLSHCTLLVGTFKCSWTFPFCKILSLFYMKVLHILPWQGHVIQLE